MESNQQIQLMEQNNSEKLKALTKIMLVSLLWRGAGLLDSDKTPTTEENARPEKEQSGEAENSSES